MWSSAGRLPADRARGDALRRLAGGGLGVIAAPAGIAYASEREAQRMACAEATESAALAELKARGVDSAARI